jgi:drug/metabolite transporter (DMT)-like permease
VFVKSTSTDRAQITYAFSAAVLALALWSGTVIATKVAVVYMSGLTAGVLRSMLAGVVAMVIALLFRLPRPSAGTDRFLLIASGLASFAVWPALMSVGIERTTASHAAIIMAMIPVFTVLITHMVEWRLPQPGWWLGAAAAFVATVILVMDQGSNYCPCRLHGLRARIRCGRQTFREDW